jgi:uncharacterized protein (TIGR02466 family)
MLNKYELYPLFSKPVYVKKLDIDCKKIKKLIQDDFEKSGSKEELSNNVDNITLSSISKKILDTSKTRYLKKILSKELEIYTKDILKYTNDFRITTSWFTKSTPSQQSNYHSHGNSMFSGVLYIQTPENSGDISFFNYRNSSMFNLIPTDYNVYNSEEFHFKLEPGLIIIFPSEVHHKILKNNSYEQRFSLAFNAIPIGDIHNKLSDSYVNIK